MANTRTTVEILNKDLEKVAEIRNLYPINRDGYVLRYSKELSDYGKCKFRVSTKDPIFTTLGDILEPHAYHVRIKRGDEVVWQGAIVDNTERNKNFVEVEAAEYLFYLDKILIRRDKDKPDTTEDESNFRLFNSGSMASAVQTIINQAKEDLGANHPLAGLQIGTIENPDFPNNFVKADGSPLTGGWEFSDDNIALQFDYHPALYALKAFGIYSSADFELTKDLVFNFKKLIGKRITGLTFSYRTVGGNIVDYNIPRYGQRQVNHIVGIAADEEGKVLHDLTAGRDDTSIKKYGLLQEARAFADVKHRNALAARLKEESRLVANPEESPVNIVLNEKAYPLGIYGIGDIIWLDIQDHVISYKKERRIVGMTVNLHNTGREMITIQTNKPDDRFTGES
jgi:hypothetical protein